MDDHALKGYAKNKAWGVQHNRDLLSKLLILLYLKKTFLNCRFRFVLKSEI